MFSNDVDANDPFSRCETLAEIFVVIHHLEGLDGLEFFLSKTLPEWPRETLEAAADEFAMVGLKPLAKLVHRYARRAKLGPMNFKKRWASRLKIAAD